MITYYYLRSGLEVLASLSTKLVKTQVPFIFNGGSTLKIEVLSQKKGFIDNEIEKVQKKCEKAGWRFECEENKY